MFKQPYVTRYIKYVSWTKVQGAISSICAICYSFLIRKQCIRWYRSGPPLSIHSLFRRYFLASPRTNAVCTTTLVILVTRGGGSTTEGKRSPRCGGVADRPLSCANIFFFPFLFLLFYHTHASTSSPLFFFFFFFSPIRIHSFLVYFSRSQKRDGNEK